jgi:sugar phosphate isomerase/epimerase
MKLALMIGTPDLRQPWCTVLDGSDLRSNIFKAREWGYDGIELALRDPDLLDPKLITRWCHEAGLEMIGLCTGEILGSDGLGLVDPDPGIMQAAYGRMRRVIDLAGNFGARTMVNVGRVRGKLTHDTDYRIAVDVLEKLSDHAQKASVRLVLEPINRYEVNYIHSTQDGLQFAQAVNHPGFGLMLDTYHMNIEDQSIENSLEEAQKYCWHIHISDNNRKWPGNAHVDFPSIFSRLIKIGYSDYLSAEILPWPDRKTAGLATCRYVRDILNKQEDQGD